jgi:16S rRNA (guanine527-N7)-methyltransferase
VTSHEFRDRLARRTRRAKATISVPMLGPLEAYFRLLTLWNAKINLTALPLDPPTDEAFDRLLVEPLAAARALHASASPSGSSQSPLPVWFDLGSGGGSPAIPLKIARPAVRLTMIESKERKSAFLREAVRVLALQDTSVEAERFEVIAASPEYSGTADLVTVRAIRADAELFETAGRMLREGGQLLLFRPAHSPSADPEGFERAATVLLIESPSSFLSIYRRVPRGTKPLTRI